MGNRKLSRLKWPWCVTIHKKVIPRDKDCMEWGVNLLTLVSTPIQWESAMITQPVIPIFTIVRDEVFHKLEPLPTRHLKSWSEIFSSFTQLTSTFSEWWSTPRNSTRVLVLLGERQEFYLKYKYTLHSFVTCAIEAYIHF